MAIGIKDVARVANVSAATVSRVLSGRAVNPAMQERVHVAVTQTGYRPNMAARRLRSRHSNTIGLVVADIRNPFFTAVSRSVEDIAYDRGLRVILCNTDEDPAKETMYLQLMQEERVTGVILAPTRNGVEQAAERRFDFPIVLIDRTVAGAPQDSVVLDNDTMAGLLVSHLHAAGHRRIAGFFGAASITGSERSGGYTRAMTGFGLTPELIRVQHRHGEAERAVADLMGGTDRPTALIASNGVMLTTMLRALHALGLSVPEDVALAGFDNEPWMDLVAGGLTVIEQPSEEIGRTAMAMLFERLDRPDGAPRKVVLGGRCIVRGSSAGPRGESVG